MSSDKRAFSSVLGLSAIRTLDCCSVLLNPSFAQYSQRSLSVSASAIMHSLTARNRAKNNAIQGNDTERWLPSVIESTMNKMPLKTTPKVRLNWVRTSADRPETVVLIHAVGHDLTYWIDRSKRCERNTML